MPLSTWGPTISYDQDSDTWLFLFTRKMITGSLLRVRHDIDQQFWSATGFVSYFLEFIDMVQSTLLSSKVSDPAINAIQLMQQLLTQ